MIVLPLPLIVALVLGFLFVQAILAGNRPVLFSTLLLLCALQNFVVAAGQYYGLHFAFQLQPILASTIPPLAFAAYMSASVRQVTPARDWIHLFGPAFVFFCVLFAPVTLDIVLAAIFLSYGLALLLSLHAHKDALPLVKLESGAVPQRIWMAISIALLVSAMTDLVIGYAFQTGSPGWAPKIISAGSVASLLAIGLLSVSPDLRTPPACLDKSSEDEFGQAPAKPVTELEIDLVRRLDELLVVRKFYLDPGLTLAMLAQRLHVPAKELSTAINKTTGENVSRYINKYRILHACSLLREGASVTTAMLDSGFNTKSNFNREFARVTAKTPSTWVHVDANYQAEPVASLPSDKPGTTSSPPQA